MVISERALRSLPGVVLPSLGHHGLLKCLHSGKG